MGRRVVICGAGTVGGLLTEHLARLGGLSLTVVDADRVEARNLSNQPYQRRDVGQPKARALADLLYRSNGAEVQAVTKRVTKQTVAALLDGDVVVVDAFDNHESRRLVAEHCRTRGLPCLHAGLSRDGYAEVIWNEAYRVPPDQAGDACQEPVSRTLSLLVVAVAGESLRNFILNGTRLSFTITRGDLKVTPL